MVNTLMFCVNILVICADCAGHRYSEFYGIEELNSSNTNLPSRRISNQTVMSNHMNLIQNIQTLSRIEFRKGTHLEAMFCETSNPTGHLWPGRFRNRPLEAFATAPGQYRCWAGRLPWNTLVKFEHSTIQQLKTDILAALGQQKVFLWDKVD